MIARRVVPIALALVFARSLPAQQGGLPAPTVEAVDKALGREMSKQGIPGLSVAVVTDNRLRWTAGYGFADLENFVPAKGATVYRLGSISKPITAVAAMQLVERGKLDLDAPVRRYVPSFPEKPWPVTTRQLLGHLGGVRHYRDAEIAITRHYPTLLEGLDIFKNDPLLHEPGTKYSYSTFGYNLIGCVVEAASGMRFVDYVRENVFRPAGMDRIRDDSVADIIPNRAQGYVRDGRGELHNSALADTSYKIPGGGFCSTVADLARFAVAIQEGRLLRRESVETMWTRQKTRGGAPVDYGLGWAIGGSEGGREIGHGGGQQRITTFLAILPDRRAAVAIMTNLEGARGLRQLAFEVASIALGDAPRPAPSRAR